MFFATILHILRFPAYSSVFCKVKIVALLRCLRGGAGVYPAICTNTIATFVCFDGDVKFVTANMARIVRFPAVTSPKKAVYFL